MHIQRQLREDGTCLLTLHRTDGPANVLDAELLEELDAHLAAIAEPGLGARALVLISGQVASFGEGVGPERLGREELEALVALGQRTFGRLATLPIPTIAAIHGACEAGGLELALACDWRVATSDHDTRLSLPQTRWGMLPYWGGSTRLPRLIGLLGAIDFIVEAPALEPAPALQLGLVDALAPREHLLAVALEWVAKGERPAKLAHTWLSEMVSSPLALSKARGTLQTRTRGHYPAQSKALEIIAGALRLGTVEEANALERTAALEVAEAPATRYLRELAQQEDFARDLAEHPVTDPTETPLMAIMGAGLLGTDLAYRASRHGLRVLLRAAEPAHLAASLTRIKELYGREAEEQTLSALETREALDRIAPAHTEVPLQRYGVLLEPGPEDLEAKRTALVRLEELARPEALLATATAALPLRELGASLRQPDRLFGLHFPRPGSGRDLVEVICSRQTAPSAVAKALALVGRLQLLPVLVQDSPGFLINRILQPYLSEAGELFWAGHGAREIDEAMLAFGMATGPLREMDENGIEASAAMAQTLTDAFPQWMRLPRILPKLQEAGLLGRALGKGFYTYSGDKEPRPHRAAEELRPRAKVQATAEELQRRMVLLLVNEAARGLEEGITGGAAAIDFALVRGGGFPAFRGGPLHYADAEGLPLIVEQLTALAATAGTHYTPCNLLSAKAAKQQPFFAAQ